MIISVQYKDISYEEVIKCMTEAGKVLADPEAWNNIRNTFVQIETPLNPDIQNQRIYLSCKGPFYIICNSSKKYKGQDLVCPHVAIIGD